MKLGTECEGRLRGVRTLFIDVSDVKDGFGTVKVLRAAKRHKVQQVYVLDTFNMIDYEHVGLTGPYLAGYIVTLEVTELRSPPPKWLNIMLHITNDSFWLLKQSDSIKFDSGREVGIKVCAVTVEQMVPTLAEEFKSDKKVTR